MPLLRYELGDYAIPAGSRDCPFARRSLSKIVGRERNLFRLPDGARVVPWLPHGDALALGVRKFKLMQTSLRDVQFLYVPDERDLAVDADVVQRLVDTYVSPRLRVVAVKVESIPAAPNGKYLLHESLVD
jgi:phenylacetate-CoA ligase